MDKENPFMDRLLTDPVCHIKFFDGLTKGLTNIIKYKGLPTYSQGQRDRTVFDNTKRRIKIGKTTYTLP